MVVLGGGAVSYERGTPVVAGAAAAAGAVLEPDARPQRDLLAAR